MRNHERGNFGYIQHHSLNTWSLRHHYVIVASTYQDRYWHQILNNKRRIFRGQSYLFHKLEFLSSLWYHKHEVYHAHGLQSISYCLVLKSRSNGVMLARGSTTVMSFPYCMSHTSTDIVNNIKIPIYWIDIVPFWSVSCDTAIAISICNVNITRRIVDKNIGWFTELIFAKTWQCMLTYRFYQLARLKTALRFGLL